MLITKIPFSVFESQPDRFSTTYHAYADLPSALQAMETEQTEQQRFLEEKAYSVFVPYIHALRVTPPEYHCYNLSPEDCIMLERIAMVAQAYNERQISEVDEIDVEMMARRITRSLPSTCFDGTKEWFVRLDSGSPKNGRGRAGPFKDARQVLESICTSQRAWNYLKRAHTMPGRTERLHFLPWRPDIEIRNEFRMFVPPSGRVRAISEYGSNGAWADVDAKELEDLVEKMLECHEKFRELAGAVLSSGYTFDVHCLQSPSGEGWVVEPLELNIFGAQNGAGSCLFNWIEDGSWEKMYGLVDELELRILCDVPQRK
ncbi:hypothetical protein BDZ89DRAFT_1062495 [Hymenopellis radicata]|nr:hypothetical protein BDZ89DRAFT_1062495 [Hymenopellis radicata]